MKKEWTNTYIGMSTCLVCGKDVYTGEYTEEEAHAELPRNSVSKPEAVKHNKKKRTREYIVRDIDTSCCTRCFYN